MVGVLISIWSVVGGSWSVVYSLWLVAGRWAVVLYYAFFEMSISRKNKSVFGILSKWICCPIDQATHMQS